MSAFKRFDKQDTYITTYISHKKWDVRGSEFENLGIVVNTNIQGDRYSQIKHLYYPEKQTVLVEEGSPCNPSQSIVEIPSSSNDYYYQTTLYNPDTRNLQQGAFEIIIPSTVFGTHIKQGVGLDIIIENPTEIFYALPDYWEDEYTNDPSTIIQLVQLEILDDGEGGLYVMEGANKKYIGDVIYPHGRLIITDPTYSAYLNQGWDVVLTPDQLADTIREENSPLTRNNFRIKWESSHPIFTYTFSCKLRESEYNYTLNPTVQEKVVEQVFNSDNTLNSLCEVVTEGVIKPEFLIEEFTPYITTVGLYNDADELVAVGKLSTPVPKTKQTEMTIVVKLDI